MYNLSASPIPGGWLDLGGRVHDLGGIEMAGG